MKRLLVVTAIVEVTTGVALLVAPAAVAQILLGAEIVGAAFPLGRLAGVALLALGVACWVARDDLSPKSIVIAMLVYNLGAVGVLGSAGVEFPTTGLLLWLAVGFHAAMSLWCIALSATKPAAAGIAKNNA